MKTPQFDDVPSSMISGSQLRPPDEDRAKRTNAGSVKKFNKMLENSWRDSDAFWADVASELDWVRPWDSVRKGELPHFEYFSGGIANACTNMLDRNLTRGMKNKLALIWEGENGDTKFYTYQMLHAEVCKFANALKRMGVRKGDTICIFLPNLAETVITVLACYRLGAIFNVVFSGFSATALQSRLLNFNPKIIVTADGTYRRGRVIALKAVVDEAIREVPGVEAVIVVKRTGTTVNMRPDRDRWWEDTMNGSSIVCEAEPMEANEPALVFYTSGTTGKPKGVVHAGMGFLVNNYLWCKYHMDHHPDDVLWCTADIGWITMQIWGIVGALSNGVTTIFFEGALDYPRPDRFYEIIHKYRVNKVFTAPTAIRMLMRQGDELLKPYDLTCLEVVSLVGEPLNPEAWLWFDKYVGKGKVYINNTWGQTEMGGCPIAGAAWLTSMKPGSCGVRFLGVEVDVVDDEGKQVPANTVGNLVVKSPFPMMMRTLWKEPQRFVDEYFSQIPGCYFTYDAAVRDQDGHFWVLGRLDDVINVAGHRLSTMEMESAIMLCGSVAEVAVVGVQDSLKGLVPVAFVTLKNGVTSSAALEQEIRRMVEANLSKIANPERIVFVDVLPKTPSGKIMRRLLREVVDRGQVRGDLTGLENASSIKGIVAAMKRSAEVLRGDKN